MATKFKRKGIWYIKYKDIYGKWRNISCGKTATATEAKTICQTYTAMELNYRHKTAAREPEGGLVEYIEKFRKHDLLRGKHGEKEASSVNREQTAIGNFLTYVKELGLTKFKQVTEHVVRGFLEMRKAAGIKPKTRQEDRRIVNKFFEFAIKNHYCVENPVAQVEVPRVIPKKPRFFSEEELEAIFAKASALYRQIFKFLYLTGLRIGELGNLEWRDFNEAQKHIVIRVIPGNKTKREGIVPLNEDALQIIVDRKAVAANDTYIFTNYDGNKLDNDNIYRNLKQTLDALKIKNASPHTFRHTTASHLVISGVSIYSVKELLRHKSVQETEIYAHLSNKATRNAIELLRASKPGKHPKAQHPNQVILKQTSKQKEEEECQPRSFPPMTQLGF